MKDYADYAAAAMWGAAIVLLLVLFYMYGCGGAGSPSPLSANAATCDREIKRIVSRAASPTCAIAVRRLAELAERNPACASIFGDGGLHLVCHDESDGGAE